MSRYYNEVYEAQFEPMDPQDYADTYGRREGGEDAHLEMAYEDRQVGE